MPFASKMIMNTWAKNRVFFLLTRWCLVASYLNCVRSHWERFLHRGLTWPTALQIWRQVFGAFLPNALFCTSAIYQMRHMWILLELKTHLPFKPEFIKALWEGRHTRYLLTACHRLQQGADSSPGIFHVYWNLIFTVSYVETSEKFRAPFIADRWTVNLALIFCGTNCQCPWQTYSS